MKIDYNKDQTNSRKNTRQSQQTIDRQSLQNSAGKIAQTKYVQKNSKFSKMSKNFTKISLRYSPNQHILNRLANKPRY